jgi:hypothetical protein
VAMADEVPVPLVGYGMVRVSRPPHVGIFRQRPVVESHRCLAESRKKAYSWM